MARRHVLGDIAARCERLENVPVYLNDTSGEMLGYADESLGAYADAITFHIDELLCKRLSMGHFSYGFDYEFAAAGGALTSGTKRIRLSSIHLVERKGYAKPIARSKAVASEPTQTIAPTD